MSHAVTHNGLLASVACEGCGVCYCAWLELSDGQRACIKCLL
jgi:hypothetical protein